MKKTLHGLYAITDEYLMPPSVFSDMAEAALAAGVSILQYRDKSQDIQKRIHQAHLLKALCDKHNAVFIINDDIQLAKEVDADGIHLGKNDLSTINARQQLGDNKIIGVSCYNQLTLAKAAIENSANYIAFGSFYSSTIKPDAAKAKIDLITTCKENHNIPVCCIGGINSENCSPLINAGADMLAVISDIFSSTNCDIISESCKKLINAYSRN